MALNHQKHGRFKKHNLLKGGSMQVVIIDMSALEIEAESYEAGDSSAGGG